ncbi:LysM domain-containing protein [Colletotrichum truncatum]|uniref:LysM domain-containing protein n=1 Tax=Colletotrichum truncatum TaxID=5467 RepID=A0ACC3Z1Q3_COLTU|nr:LysM domain-containing protein [Colletotrichum truncatum]XP_036580806.1 LysM domain-containing protein [Colletotrichum truncatum]KAF6780621.1 LysM domain-containing protein [Colletotrichum truncatum]KAF6788878.1 LysM domain-containing protein [Colletotrichum truncatum]
MLSLFKSLPLGLLAIHSTLTFCGVLAQETSSSVATSTSAGLSSTTSPVSTISATPSTTSSRPPTTTTTWNGVQTPLPTQAGMVADCNKFYFTKRDDFCARISSENGITFEQFLAWNPSVGSECKTLWVGVNVCVGIIGFEPTPTEPPNGIATPQPIQPGLVKNCHKFHLVQGGELCGSVLNRYGITLQHFTSWNPAVGSPCSLWADTHVCVGVFDAIPSYQSYGCYTEVPTRALSYAGLTGQSTMTVEFCSVYCMVEKGRSLFGVQFGGECWCGDALTVGSLRTESTECNVPCTGNSTQRCGGNSRLNVYGKPNSPPVAYKAHGCYTEGTNTRAFGIANLMSDSMTVGVCADYCLRQRRTTHFGVEFGRECWCGNNLGIGAVTAAAGECSMACAGNAAEKCGAANRLNVYSTSIDPPPMNFRYQGCFTELSNSRALNGGKCPILSS